MKRADLSIDKNSEGAWRVSGCTDDGRGYYITERFYFYTKREAIALFMADHGKK